MLFADRGCALTGGSVQSAGPSPAPTKHLVPFRLKNDQSKLLQCDIMANINSDSRKLGSGLDDFGDMVLRGDGGSGYVRIDWFTPDGLSTWGDVRLTILGTEGFIELRKNVDIGGRPGGDHLFLVDQKETRYVDCTKQALPYGEQLVSDILNRTDTAMSQEHCFLATEVALKAQKQAQPLKLKI